MTHTSPSRECAGVIAGFALLTAALTFPQVVRLTSHTGVHSDALFSVWRLAWIAHQMRHDPLHLFDANIFYPELGTLALSDAILLPGLLATPFLWAGLSPVAVHNGLILLSFVASGVAMYALVRSETQSVPAAWLAGVVFAFQPYRFAHFAQLELLWSWPVPLAFLALSRLLARRRVRDGLALGATVVLQALCCLYYAVYVCTALLGLSVIRLWGRSWAELRALMKPLAAATLVVVTVGGLYAMPYIASTRTVGTRSEEEARHWSPTWRNYLATPTQNWLYGNLTGRFGHLEGVMFPGIIATALATVALAGWRTRHVLAYAIVLAVAFDLSLGFNGLIYSTLYRVMWPFHNLRVPARMFVIVSAVLAALAGSGLARVLQRLPGPLLRRVAAGVLVGLVLVESASTPVALSPVPEKPGAVYRWLELQPDAVVLEWPVPSATNLGETDAPLFMYYSTFHWKRLVNGYSGRYPPFYLRFIEAVRDLPSRQATQRLQRTGVNFLILHSTLSPGSYRDLRTQLEQRPEYRLLLVTPEGKGEVAIYGIAPR